MLPRIWYDFQSCSPVLASAFLLDAALRMWSMPFPPCSLLNCQEYTPTLSLPHLSPHHWDSSAHFLKEEPRYLLCLMKEEQWHTCSLSLSIKLKVQLFTKHIFERPLFLNIQHVRKEGGGTQLIFKPHSSVVMKRFFKHQEKFVLFSNIKTKS